MRRSGPYIITVALLAGALAPAAATQGAEKPVTVKLEPVGGSGISGTVVLSARGDETDFAVTLTAADKAKQRQEYDLWVHAGTCAAPGKKVEDIDDFHADGRTEHEDEDVVLADLVRTDHILVVHEEDRTEVLACGAIPR